MQCWDIPNVGVSPGPHARPSPCWPKHTWVSIRRAAAREVTRSETKGIEGPTVVTGARRPAIPGGWGRECGIR